MAGRTSSPDLHRFWLGVLVAGLALVVPLGTASAFTLITPIPGIHYSAADKTDGTLNGVSPNSGSSGTQFTFYVKYFDTLPSPGLAPSAANLLIDLDGNGVAGGVVTPFAQPRWPSQLLAALALLWVLTWLLARRIARLRPVFTGAGVALVIVLVTLGCGSSSKDGTVLASGAGLATCSSPAGETIAMTDMGGGSPDYAAGVLFTAQATLTCQPGVVLFMFDFRHAAGPAYKMAFGTAPNLHTLVINP